MAEEVRRGTAYGAAAYLLWGLFPLYWPLLEPAGALEILAHRVVWSLVVVLVILAAQRRWRWVANLDRRALILLAVAAVLIAINWFTYIYGVNSGQVVETALGYFITPLMSVLLGVAVLGERLRGLQWVAVVLGTVAVVVLTVDYARVPVIAFTLALSFGIYGLIKKHVGDRVGSVQSLTVETFILLLPAIGWLLVLESRNTGEFGDSGVGHALLLVSSGIVTAIPLLLFGAAARRVPLTVIGMLQYLAPVLQFLTGVLLYDEPMPPVRLLGFALVWLALGVLTFDAVAQVRRNQRRAAAEVAAGAYV